MAQWRFGFARCRYVPEVRAALRAIDTVTPRNMPRKAAATKVMVARHGGYRQCQHICIHNIVQRSFAAAATTYADMAFTYARKDAMPVYVRRMPRTPSSSV